MTFKIYDVVTGGSELWVSANNSVTTDSDGVYNFILADVNLPFDVEYYLGVKVANDAEMTPRINLTSSPYAFRANETDFLNSSRNYEMQNLTLGEKITFTLGGIIDNIVDGWITLTGGLNVIGHTNLSGNLYAGNSTLFVNASSGFVGIGTATPSHKLQVIGNISSENFNFMSPFFCVGFFRTCLFSKTIGRRFGKPLWIIA